MMPVTAWPSLYRPHEGQRFTARALFARVESPRTYARREDVPRWSGAEFHEGYRSLANVLRLSWLALDFDNGATAEQIDRTFGDLAGFAHTTWSHTPERPRWRVAVVLDRSVSRDEFDRVWRAGAALAETAGLAPDFAARDASRAWALPARHDGDHYQAHALRGALFDVGQALRAFPPPAPLSEPATRADVRSDLAHRIERARLYLATMPPGLQGSNGSGATFMAAVVLVRGFMLPEGHALRLLVEDFNPRCAPSWSVWELRHKVRSAVQRGRLEPGWLADRPLVRTA